MDNNQATVEQLHALVAELTARVEALEAELDTIPRRRAGDPSEEEMLAISAAVAAYLGKRATIKQVHLRRGAGWAQQGRVGVQTSHTIPHGVR